MFNKEVSVTLPCYLAGENCGHILILSQTGNVNVICVLYCNCTLFECGQFQIDTNAVSIPISITH